MDTVNTELIRGHVDTIILNSLLERDRYGYEILDMISDLSEGRYEIKQPTLYSCLKRLEKQGFITSYFGDESQGGRRRYYQLTEKGKATLEQDQREWEFSRTIINRLLSDKEIDLRTVEAPFNPSELRPLTRRVKIYDDEAVEDGESTTESKSSVTVQEIQEVAVSNETVNNVAEAVVVTTEETVSVTPEQQEQVADKATEKYNKEELMRIREQQTAASKRLGIGEFAERRMLINDDGSEAMEVVEPRPRPAFTDASYGYGDINQTSASGSEFFGSRTIGEQDERLNYRAALGAIFTANHDGDNQNDMSRADRREQNELDNQGRARHFGDLKQSLYEEGYNLKPYNKANSTNYYYMKFIYSNKILRDTAIFTYLVLVIEVLIMILAKEAFAVSTGVCVAIGCIGLIIPLIPIIMWALNPTKRIKAQFNFGSAIIYAIVAFIVISGISIIIALVIPSQVDWQKGGVYIPIMLSALIPIAVAIYGLLYRSSNYHLKK